MGTLDKFFGGVQIPVPQMCLNMLFLISRRGSDILLLQIEKNTSHISGVVWFTGVSQNLSQRFGDPFHPPKSAPIPIVERIGFLGPQKNL